MHFARDPRLRTAANGAPHHAPPRRLTARLAAVEQLEDRQMLSADGLLDGLTDESALLSTTIDVGPIVEPLSSVVGDGVEPLAGSASPGGYSPTRMREAYGFDQVLFDGGTIVGDGTGQTIAIVNAYHTPNAASDLAAFDAYFGLTAPPSFTQVDQSGGTSYPGTNSGWALETALDVQWAHAFAPGANILLVEANSANFSDLMVAVDYARNYTGVSVVSMSWGSAEFLSELSYDTHFTTPVGHDGVTFFGAAGNSGGPGVYPAYSPNVVAVGGTHLTLDASNNIVSETAWANSGGGISQYEAQPTWQNGVVTQTATQRGMPDVAFDGDPNTGVAVYDTFNNSPGTPWTKVAGTSFAAPSWAALVAVANQGRALAGVPVFDMATLMPMLYTMPASNFNDILSGTTGGSIPQSAGPGYDLVTGRGSPKVELIVDNLVGVSDAPSGVMLLAISDTGVSDSDGITKYNNSSPATELSFEVSGTVAGATVTIYAGATAIGSAVAVGTTTTVVTNGASTLADGLRSITARQTESGQSESGDSPSLEITIDTAAPLPTIVAVTPDPRTTPVDSLLINFNEVVSGLDLAALSLTRDAGPNLLSVAQTIGTVDGLSWTIDNLTSTTAAPGFYTFVVTSALSPVIDVAGNVAGDTSTSFTVAATVLGRMLFYNQSVFDGNNAAINAADDTAIATDKIAYLPGTGIASFDNATSYNKGINGVMIDLAGSHPDISAADFTFRVGNDNSPGSWSDAPAPVSISVRAGAGVDGADRVELVWTTGAIVNTWLEVTVAANAHTGLLASDVFYFGNRIGDTGLFESPTALITNASDEIQARTNGGVGATVSNAFDFDRNSLINAFDQIIARVNGGFLTRIDIGNVPAAPVAATAPTVESNSLQPEATPAAASPLATSLSARGRSPNCVCVGRSPCTLGYGLDGGPGARQRGR